MLHREKSYKVLGVPVGIDYASLLKPSLAQTQKQDLKASQKQSSIALSCQAFFVALQTETPTWSYTSRICSCGSFIFATYLNGPNLPNDLFITKGTWVKDSQESCQNLLLPKQRDLCLT